jgi:sialidase-1
MNPGIAAIGVVLAVLIAGNAVAQERWTHPDAKPLECTKNGPFVQMDDGALLVVEKNVLRTSTDGGKTWSAPGAVIDEGMNIGHIGHVGQMVRTREGAYVILYLDFTKYNFTWDEEAKRPKDDCTLELWAIRSEDGGKTWTDKQQLFGGYNADFMGFIQTSKGRLVATVEHLDPEAGRWFVASFSSDNQGKTWRRSNWIDLGGRGHHDGAVEPMLTELADGRLLMLIRTGLGQFWKAYSDDGGLYWRSIEPSGIDASSAPGWLLRLKSGRLALVWNRLNSERKGEWPKGAANSQAFEMPASWHREELSIAFSEDSGETWTKPVVLAYEDGGQLAYPYLMERSPGELWVFTRYTWHTGGKAAPPVSVMIKEEDFVKGK